MTWTRLPDTRGFARWRALTDTGLANHILANRQGIIAAVAGRIVNIGSEADLEHALARLLEKLDRATYEAAAEAILEAWRTVVRPAQVVPLRRHAVTVDLREARG